MPLYEYECGACGHRFEVIQKFSDSPIERCPLCAEPVHKLLSAPAIQFKGTGWYVTDYASKRNTEAAADASSSKSADGAKTPSSTSTADSSKAPSSTSTSDSSKTAPSGEPSSSKSTTASDSSAAKTDTKRGKSLPE
jgi:putative FmdB family regulatory protein